MKNTQDPEIARRDQAGRFARGASGNPAGRPRGARNKATRAAETLLEGQAEALTQRAIEAALEGDGAALRLCMERILPPVKRRPMELDVGPVESARDVARVNLRLLEAVAEGQIPAADARDALAVFEGARAVLETAELEQRIADLERRIDADAKA